MTDTELKELVASVAVSIRENDARLATSIHEMVTSIRETDERLAASIRETDERLTASIRETDERLTASIRGTDERLAAKSASIREEMAAEHCKTELALRELKQRIDEVTKQLGDMGNIQGDVAEDLFKRNVSALLRTRGIDITSVETNLKVPGLAEFDIVALNGSEAVVVEVKNKLKQDHLQKFIEQRLPRFKQAFPMFESFKLYGGVGSLVVSENLEKQAERLGLFVFTQTPDGGAGLVNTPDFTPRFF